MGALASGFSALRGMGLRSLGNEVCDENGCYSDGTPPASSGNNGGGDQTTYTSAPDGGSIANCQVYDSKSDCALCAPGSTVDGTGGCMTALPTPGGADTCVAAGGTWANNTCTNAGNTNLIAGQQAYNNPTTCAAAGGNWNGSTCLSSSGTPFSAAPVNALSSFFTSLGRALGTTTIPAGTTAVPAGYMNLGGTLIPYSTVMLVGGLAALLIVMKKK